MKNNGKDSKLGAGGPEYLSTQLTISVLKNIAKGKGVITMALDECPTESDLESRRTEEYPYHTPYLSLMCSGRKHRNSDPSLDDFRVTCIQKVRVISCPYIGYHR